MISFIISWDHTALKVEANVQFKLFYGFYYNICRHDSVMFDHCTEFIIENKILTFCLVSCIITFQISSNWFRWSRKLNFKTGCKSISGACFLLRANDNHSLRVNDNHSLRANKKHDAQQNHVTVLLLLSDATKEWSDTCYQ